MRLAIELDSSNLRGYGRVHREGCQDLKDPESIGEVRGMSDLAIAIEDATGWDEPILDLAPCVNVEAGE